MAASVSLTAAETSRKGVALAMKALATPGKAAACADAMRLSEPVISKIKNERLEDVVTLLAHLGLQVIPADYAVVDPHALEFLKRLHARVANDPVLAHILWEPHA
jgi:hypothetical protein